jgi:Putative collagen-binding domain of a collagenase
VPQDTKTWVTKSALSGHKWVVACDEQGSPGSGVVPDSVDKNHDRIRKYVLWGNLMNGGAGVEYYFGYNYANSDLLCQDYRSRENMWNLSRHALQFFYNFTIPFWTMVSSVSDTILNTAGSTMCLATPDKGTIVVYLMNGGSESVQLSSIPLTVCYTIRWYNPLAGGHLQQGTIETICGGGTRSIGNAPYNLSSQDWVVLIRKN